MKPKMQPPANACDTLAEPLAAMLLNSSAKTTLMQILCPVKRLERIGTFLATTSCVGAPSASKRGALDQHNLTPWKSLQPAKSNGLGRLEEKHATDSWRRSQSHTARDPWLVLNTQRHCSLPMGLVWQHHFDIASNKQVKVQRGYQGWQRVCERQVLGEAQHQYTRHSR